MMLVRFGWNGNYGSDVTLAMYHRQIGICTCMHIAQGMSMFHMNLVVFAIYAYMNSKFDFYWWSG